MQSWTSVPHIFLMREVNASRLIAWREQLLKRPSAFGKITYTDLLVKVVARALREHPRINATWNAGTITLNNEVNVGLAAATEDGLVVPVIHLADTLSISEIAKRRKEDAFTAIVNAPQTAILAVSRMADRVVAVGGQAVVQPMIVFSLSCDHRMTDGAPGRNFWLPWRN